MIKENAVKMVNNEIKSYRLQRSNAVYNSMSLGPIAEAFRINMPNIAMLSEPIIGIGTIIALVGALGIGYWLGCKVHDKFFDNN